MIKFAPALAAALSLASVAALAQTPAPSAVRTIVDRADVTAGQEAAFGRADIPVGVTSGRHIHHGLEAAYVAEGTVELKVQGQPDRIMKVGDTFLMRAGVPHEARSIGPGAARIISTWIIDKGKPLAEPAPAN